MLEKVTKTAGRHPKAAHPFIDCDIHNYIASDAVLMQYLDPRWHNHHQIFGHRSHPVLAFHGAPYPRVAGVGKRKDATPPSGLPIGADFEFFRQQHLDSQPLEYGILNCLSRAGDQLHEEYDAALARAINDWQLEEWLKPDDRMRGSIIVPYENGDLSAEEIDRMAPDRRHVQVMLKPRTKEPLGRRRYWKMYEAAERHGIPVAVHFGGYSANPITSGGWPSFYIEDHTNMPQTFQCHIISLICEGVFDRFPSLRIVMVEAGFAWLPSLMWRMDKHWKRLAAEVPHVIRRPSEIIREHLLFTTQPMEEPLKPEYLTQFFEHCGSGEMLMFATDYPHWDYDNPERVLAGMPEHLKRKVFLETARKLYNLAPRES